MKKTLSLLLLLFTISVFSQSKVRVNDKEHFNAYLIVDPYASYKEKGLNIGAGVEYVGFIYVGASTTTFPVLKDGYTELIGSIGLPLTYGYDSGFIAYVGIRGGVIKRAVIHPTFGLEGGFNIDLDSDDEKGLYLGLKATYIYRSDFEFYDYPNGYRPSGFIVIGFKI